MSLTNEEIQAVQSSWEKCVPIADKAAELFYGKLFELDPNLKPLFKGDMQEQGKKLMTMITVAVNGLNDLEKIVSHCDLNNSQKPRFKHHASVNDYSQRLSRSQISLIRAQNRKNFVNFAFWSTNM